MRENMGLYRGQRINNGKWIYGYLQRVTLNGMTAWIIFADAFELANGNVKASSHAQVDPNTVGECSGIPDKNDERIFEGDILCVTYLCQKPVTGVVSFRDGKFVVDYIRNGNAWTDTLTEVCSVLYEIIGNIHDKPDFDLRGAGT